MNGTRRCRRLPVDDGLWTWTGRLGFLLFGLLAANPTDIRLLEERRGILKDVHVATNRDEDVDIVMLLAVGDVLAVQETSIQDEPLDHPLAHGLYELFDQFIKHRALVVFA